jgi:hypothetical protein
MVRLSWESERLALVLLDLQASLTAELNARLDGTGTTRHPLM